MKLIRRPDLSSEEGGEYVLHTEDNEDMWHLYNLISVGDVISAKTMRKVVNMSSTGSTSSEKVATRLFIRVETIEWDADTCSLRLKGVNTEENSYVRLGQYHTLEITSNMTLGIRKAVWDRQHVERIKMACNPLTHCQVAAVVMHMGLAHVCFITKYMTIVKAKIELSVPKKRAGPSGHDKAVTRFYTQVAEAVHKTIPLNEIKCMLVASPAFVADEFTTFLFARAKQEGWRDVLDNRAKVRVVHTASGHKHALNEALQDPSVKALIADTSAMQETALMERFMELMNTEPDRAYYGLEHVRKVARMGAIEVLMVSDALFKSSDVRVRGEYVRLVQEVRESGAEVVVFSAANVSGEQLTQITGVAAILRYPVVDIDDAEEEARYANTHTVSSVAELEARVGQLHVADKDKHKDKHKKKDKKEGKVSEKKVGKNSKKSSKGSDDEDHDDVMYI